MNSEQEVLERLVGILGTELNLQKITCPNNASDRYQHIACFVTDLEARGLITNLTPRLAEFARITSDWREDYSVWGAFFRVKNGTGILFGINYVPIEFNPELRDQPLLKNYKAMVDVTVAKEQ
ncbi:hypothetical protein [Calidithermus terrae]|uniref:hypothetical protein n=1 Tax=Calidithermus terrae TaxID=1408545 RepID=UPI0011C438D7|nr:hypothetical protein [Calidithermus terrae]